MKKSINEKGITLVALVVTVVVLMILSGIIITTSSDNNGVLNIAKDKKEETERMSLEESIKIELEEDNPQSYEELIEFLSNYGKIINEDSPEEATLITTKGNYEFLIKNIWNVNKQEIGVTIGDYIEYKYDGGTYEINGENSGTNQVQNIEEIENTTSIWKVIDVNKQNNQIKIIPTTLNSNNVTLKGANGFNNGVKILNDICNTLFSNVEYNTTARNINIEDIEKIISNTKELRSSRYGTEKKYTSLMYPSVLNDEKDISIQKNFFNGTKTSDNISFIQTYYTGNIEYIDDYKSIIPNGEYWISTRAINNTESNAEYYLRTLIVSNTSNIAGTKLFDSKGQTGTNTFNILPVVTLSDITFLEGNGTQELPYKFIE